MKEPSTLTIGMQRRPPFRFVRGNKANAVPVLLELAVPLGRLLDHTDLPA